MLELIITFPFLIIVLLATVEIALIMAASKHVEFASRLGAESGRVDLANLVALKPEIDEYLLTAGYTDSCTVILEHNAAGVANPMQTFGGGCNCGPTPPGPLPMTVPGPPVTAVESVRVTVCLPMDGNIPNCLSTFGLDLADCTIQHSTVWHVETNP